MPAGQVDEMFSVRQNVWWQGTSADHGQAHIIPQHPTWEQARVLAGLAWEAVSMPVFEWTGVTTDDLMKQFGKILVAARAGDVTLDQAAEQLMEAHATTFAQIGGWQKIARDDRPMRGNTMSLNADSYEVISHQYYGEIFERVLETDPEHLLFETGGSLDDGKRVWMLIKLDEPMTITGTRGRKDSSFSMPYLALTSRHDGKAGLTLRATAVRIVCANTFNMAELEGERSGATYTFVHRGDWRARIEDARNAVTGARQEMQRYADLGGHMLGMRVSKAQTEWFVQQFAPMPPMASDRVARNTEEIREGLRMLLAGPTVEGAGIGGTPWGLLQGAGEYLDWMRKAQKWETRLNRQLLKPEKLKHAAVDLAMAAAKA